MGADTGPGVGLVHPPLRHHARHRHLLGGIDHDHPGHGGLAAARLHQQGDVEHDHVVGTSLSRHALRHHCADVGMGELLEVGQGRGVVEHDLGQGGAIDGPVHGHDAVAEALDDPRVGGAAGGLHLSGDFVGVDEDRPPLH